MSRCVGNGVRLILPWGIHRYMQNSSGQSAVTSSNGKRHLFLLLGNWQCHTDLRKTDETWNVTHHRDFLSGGILMKGELNSSHPIKQQGFYRGTVRQDHSKITTHGCSGYANTYNIKQTILTSQSHDYQFIIPLSLKRPAADMSNVYNPLPCRQRMH